MILNKAQAKAIYSAMAELNNVGMRLEASVGGTRVYENFGGNVVVDAFAQPTETYVSQHEFANVYGLLQD